jgi:CRISPR-associated endoribonuclease Cas6/Csy4 subtype I-F
MTTHYLDYRVAEPEAGSGEISHLLARLWQRLHGVLASQDIRRVGVSLPAMGARHPGHTLRLHSDADTLAGLAGNPGMLQLVEGGGLLQGSVQPAPEHCGYGCFRRSRAAEKQSAAWLLRTEERWIRRQRERGNLLTADDVLQRRKALQARASDTDGVYLKLLSRSTHQGFSLRVQAQPVAQPQLGTFTHYGLGVGGATVPWGF